MSGTTITIEQVEQALVAFEDAMTPEQPSSMAALGGARVALAKCVNDFIAGETEQVSLMERCGFGRAPQSEQQALYKELIALRIRYSAHIARWTPAQVAADWRRYRSDSVSLVIGMRKILRARRALREAQPA